MLVLKQELYILKKPHVLVLTSLVTLLVACSEPTADETSLLDDTKSKTVESIANVSQNNEINIASLQQRMSQLSSDLENAEAMAAIKRLQWAYGHYSEFGLWHDFADLFSENAVGHYSAGDLNRDEIRRLFVDQVGQGQLGLAEGRLYPHISFTPVINLSDDGQSAKARFRILAMLGGYGGNATWAHGVYENGYIKEEGVWKVSELGYHGVVSGLYGETLNSTLSTPLSQATVPFHYYPEQIGRVKNSEIKLNKQFESQDLSVLFSEFTDLESRAERLSAEMAVSNLQHQFGFMMDNKQWNSVTELFAENATMELDAQGVYVGKASIRNSLERFGSQGLQLGELRSDLQFQSYVSVSENGQYAKARITQLGMHGTDYSLKQWREGIYENDYVKEEGEWKIKSLHFYPRLITAYDQGWAKQASPIEALNSAFLADLPPTEEYNLYPSFYIPAFHFTHPVTQLMPQYPSGDPAENLKIELAENLDQYQTTPVDSINTLHQRLTATEAKVLISNAYNQSENLISGFSFYLDEHMWTAAAQLFSQDGTNQGPNKDIARGPENIQKAIVALYGSEGRSNEDLTLHHVVQPVINVAEDGLSAQFTARIWMVKANVEAEDSYLVGMLQGSTVLKEGKWKIQEMAMTDSWAVSYLEGSTL